MSLTTYQQQKKTNLLIDLDSLLDTRLGTIRTLYPDNDFEIEQNKLYRLRISDEMNLVDARIDPLKYTASYLKRDKVILRNSRISLVVAYLRKMLENLQGIMVGNNPILQDIKVTVNTYPYQLDITEKQLFAAGVQANIGLKEPPQLRYIEPETLTLKYMDENDYFMYVVYDFNGWASAAFDDRKADSLEAMGLRRIENFTVIAPRLAVSVEAHEEAKKELKKSGLPLDMNELAIMPWGALFDLELIDPVFFTEFEQQIADQVMTNITKSTSPIDLEVDIASGYLHMLENVRTPKEHLAFYADRLEVVSKLINEQVKLGSQMNVDKLRCLLAEQRFLNDCICVYVPNFPAQDYERYVDSLMSWFDWTVDYAEVTEEHWNARGVGVKRLVKTVPKTDREGRVFVAIDDYIDQKTKEAIKKGQHLPSAIMEEPVLEPINQEVINKFFEDIQ